MKQVLNKTDTMPIVLSAPISPLTFYKKHKKVNIKPPPIPMKMPTTVPPFEFYIDEYVSSELYSPSSSEGSSSSIMPPKISSSDTITPFYVLSNSSGETLHRLPSTDDSYRGICAFVSGELNRLPDVY